MPSTTTTTTMNSHNDTPSTKTASPTTSLLLQTAQTFLTSYSTLSAHTLTVHLSPHFTHTVLPASLSLPTRDISAFQSHAEKIFSLFKTFAMLPQSMYEDPSNRTVVCYVKMGGEIAEGMVAGLGVAEWWNEAVLIVEVDGEGMVCGLVEFVDSAKAGELRGRLEKKGERTLDI